MGQIALGYGSEWHLLRLLGWHRRLLTQRIQQVVDIEDLEWLDFPVDPSGKMHDEWKNVDFLERADLSQLWAKRWPQTGNVPNWDAVGRGKGGSSELRWILVEAKAHTGELQTECKASKRGGLDQIEKCLAAVKESLGVSSEAAWLKPYYQYCNRLAVLHFLREHEVDAHLVFAYFVGDVNPKASCPKTEQEWSSALEAMKRHVGIPVDNGLSDRIHQVFLSTDLRQLAQAARES